MSSKSKVRFTVLGAFFAVVLGPILAGIVTWKPVLDVASIAVEEHPSSETIRQLRAMPEEATLLEVRGIAVSSPLFAWMEDAEAVAAASDALAGRTVLGNRRAIRVPFEANEDTYGVSTWHLDLCSFATPSLLARAYEASGEQRYLRAAVDYVLDWAEFESSLRVPRGFVFNDHAIAARAIVMTEIWRVYRDSDLFEIGEAAELLAYVEKLALLLGDPRLFEYRTNHGFMQSLSLLHLTIAFPLLENVQRGTETAVDRLLMQYEYYVNDEGVVLEHSPMYHHNGLRRLTSAARYMGILGRALPDEWIERYEKALRFEAVLARPDGSLPPIGDTEETGHEILDVVQFDDSGVASSVRTLTEEDLVPRARVTIKPKAGYVVLWDGLEHWPEETRLEQTVVHWANFPDLAHKHADEMGVSIWSGGEQWIRAVGYWPYNSSRSEVIGWQSSNAPHWLSEPYEQPRRAQLVASAMSDTTAFFALKRTNADGRSITRQIVKLGPGVWAIVDAFKADEPAGAEIIWRLPAEAALERLSDTAYRAQIPEHSVRMNVLFDQIGRWSIVGDLAGTAPWNSGVVTESGVTRSAAIRASAEHGLPVLASVFHVHDTMHELPVDDVDLQWQNEDAWSLRLRRDGAADVTVERERDRLRVNGHEDDTASLNLMSWSVPPTGRNPEALRRAEARYGTPFHPILQRRSKVTALILALAVGQIPVFLLVRRLAFRLWRPLLICSIASWLALSAFLGLSFLA